VGHIYASAVFRAQDTPLQIRFGAARE
jgi:hypothetical protein